MKIKVLAACSIVMALAMVMLSSFKPMADDPWTSKQLMEPQLLAPMITNLPANQQPVIINVGPMSTIKGAISIGAAGKEAGIEALAAKLKDIPKDKQVVIYCGCCPLFKCPNVRPAFNLLTKEGYTNIHVLNLSTNLKMDWVDKGYPVEKEQ